MQLCAKIRAIPATPVGVSQTLLKCILKGHGIMLRARQSVTMGGGKLPKLHPLLAQEETAWLVQMDLKVPRNVLFHLSCQCTASVYLYSHFWRLKKIFFTLSGSV